MLPHRKAKLSSTSCPWDLEQIIGGISPSSCSTSESSNVSMNTTWSSTTNRCSSHIFHSNEHSRSSCATSLLCLMPRSSRSFCRFRSTVVVSPMQSKVWASTFLHPHAVSEWDMLCTLQEKILHKAYAKLLKNTVSRKHIYRFSNLEKGF